MPCDISINHVQVSLKRIVTVKMVTIHFQTDCAKIEKTAELTLILIYARFDNRA